MDENIFDICKKQKERYIENIYAVNTPLTMKTQLGLHLCLYEANLTDYEDMTLAYKDENTLQAELVPGADGSKVKAKATFVSLGGPLLLHRMP